MFLNQKGMTITEFVVVTGLILAMTVLSVPVFFFLKGLSFDKEVKNISIEINTNIQNWSVEKMGNYPTHLDAEPSSQRCQNCFSEITNLKFDQELWFKENNSSYFFSRNGSGLNLNDYKESGDYQLTYNSVTGEVVLKQL